MILAVGIEWDGIGGLIFIKIKIMIMISKNGKNCEKLEKCGGPIGPKPIIFHFHHYRYHNKLKKERDNKVSPFSFYF